MKETRGQFAIRIVIPRNSVWRLINCSNSAGGDLERRFVRLKQMNGIENDKYWSQHGISQSVIAIDNVTKLCKRTISRSVLEHLIEILLNVDLWYRPTGYTRNYSWKIQCHQTSEIITPADIAVLLIL